MAAANTDMLDAIQDRILIINKAHKVVYANASARADFSGELSALLNCAPLRDALQRITVQGLRESIDLHLTPDPALPDKTAKATVVTAPNGLDAVVIVHPSGTGVGQATVSAQTVAELFRQHVLKDLHEFLTATEELALRGLPLPQKTGELTRRLMDQLEKVLDLISVFGQDALVGDERILPDELIREICQELNPAAKQARMKITTSGLEEGLTPVYGSRKWIKRAFREIIENAIVYSATKPGLQQDGLIEISARQTGAFLMLHFRNWGAAAAPVAQQGRYVVFGGAPHETQANGRGLRIGLPLAQRILELHGGTLRVRSDNDGLTEVILQIPTGAPFQSHAQLDMAQAQRYAEDLARLMAGRKRKPAGQTSTA